MRLTLYIWEDLDLLPLPLKPLPFFSKGSSHAGMAGLPVGASEWVAARCAMIVMVQRCNALTGIKARRWRVGDFES